MLTDVVGSTARDLRLGPERAGALRRSHFTEAATVVMRFGGRVVKSLGDGQLSVFSSPSASIAAGVEIQQLCVRHSQGHADPLQLRIGISAGELRFEDDGDCHGRAVVEAARLCAYAQAGEVVVSEMTTRLSTMSSHPLRSLGSLTLKGLDGPVEAYRVEWRPLIAGRRFDMAEIDADPDLRARAAGMLDRIGRDQHMTRVRSRILELLAPRPGQSVLDVGCGAGDDVFLLAGLVGPSGWTVGIDRSRTMVDEALRRAAETGIEGVQFIHSDASSLDFTDATFDAVRSDRMFQYVLEPQAVLSEMCRVTRPGGRVVVAETDWQTAVFDAPDDVTARINAAWAASRPNGRAGQQLYRLCKVAGLVDVSVEGIVQIKTELDELYRDGVLPALAKNAVDAEAVTPEEASRWLAGLEVAAEQGLFLRAFTTFVVFGRVPSSPTDAGTKAS
jgi:ubiquinone/menaquinone biosynthesis C-methylase UbiE